MPPRGVRGGFGERIWSAAASGIPRDAALARAGRKAVPRATLIPRAQRGGKAVPRPAHSAALVTALQVPSGRGRPRFP
jgi:hypothetical protein